MKKILTSDPAAPGCDHCGRPVPMGKQLCSARCRRMHKRKQLTLFPFGAEPEGPGLAKVRRVGL